jgi:Uma2 family endonuclease
MSSATLTTVPPRRRATYDDLLAAPKDMVAEVIDGELLLFPRPAKPHAAAATALEDELGLPFKRGRGGPGGWILLFEPELHLGDDILVPDLAGWRRERMPALVDDVPYFTMAPDWVCEVLSPGTAGVDRAKKLPVYAREGVGHAWLVDPLARTLEVLRRDGARWLIVGAFADDAGVRAEPFEAIELGLGGLWADVQGAPLAERSVSG